jgi:hypothetical protein
MLNMIRHFLLYILVWLTTFGLAESAQRAEPPSKTPAGVVVPGGKWETLRTGEVDIHFQLPNASDARLYAGFFESAHRRIRDEFSGFDVDALASQPVRCGVWLHPTSGDAVSAGGALNASSGGPAAYCELHFLTPAAYTEKDRCCTKVGEVRDVDQMNRIAVHEYVTIVLDRITRQRSGWRYHSAPKWFEQGYEEYLACMIASEHTRTVTLSKYRDLLAGTPSRLRDNGEVENPYIEGTVVVEYLHAEFGRQKVQAILTNPSKTFDEALRATLGFDQRELFERVRTKVSSSR